MKTTKSVITSCFIGGVIGMAVSIALMPYSLFYWLMGAFAGATITYFGCDITETISAAPQSFKETREKLGEFWLFNGETSPEGLIKVIAVALALIEGGAILSLLLQLFSSSSQFESGDVIAFVVFSGIFTAALFVFTHWFLYLPVANGEDEIEPKKMFSKKLEIDTRWVDFPDDYPTFLLYFARGFARVAARCFLWTFWGIPLLILLIFPYAVLWFLKVLAEKIYSHKRMGAATGTFIGVMLAVFASPDSLSAIQKVFLGGACSAVIGGVLVQLPLNKLAEIGRAHV